MIDKQVRDALIEYQCRCMRMDKVRIPLIGWFIGAFKNRWGYLPRFHLVTARVGYGAGAIVAERWMFKGNDLHSAYDTRQIFRSDYSLPTFTQLPPVDFAPLRSWVQKVQDKYRYTFSNLGAFVVGIAAAFAAPHLLPASTAIKAAEAVTESAVKVLGRVQYDGIFALTLSDGSSRMLPSNELVKDAKGLRFKHGPSWIYLGE